MRDPGPFTALTLDPSRTHERADDKTEVMMSRTQMLATRLLGWACLALLACLAAASAAWADEPWLALRLVGGDSAVYPVSSVEQVHFEEAAVIVVTSGGADSYATEEIAKIEFLWDPENSSWPGRGKPGGTPCTGTAGTMGARRWPAASTFTG